MVWALPGFCSHLRAGVGQARGHHLREDRHGRAAGAVRGVRDPLHPLAGHLPRRYPAGPAAGGSPAGGGAGGDHLEGALAGHGRRAQAGGRAAWRGLRAAEGLSALLRAVLFDMDGVLLESEEAWEHVVAAAGEQFRGRPVTREEFQPTFGQGTEADVRVFGLRCTPAELDRFYLEHFPRYARHVWVNPEARGLLET